MDSRACVVLCALMSRAFFSAFLIDQEILVMLNDYAINPLRFVVLHSAFMHSSLSETTILTTQRLCTFPLHFLFWSHVFHGEYIMENTPCISSGQTLHFYRFFISGMQCFSLPYTSPNPSFCCYKFLIFNR